MNTSQNQGWDSFWRGTSEQAAFAKQGPQEATLRQLWAKAFDEALASLTHPRMLDLMSGNGMVTALMHEAIVRRCPPSHSLHSLDASSSAIAALKLRIPSVEGIVADARNTSLASHSFDIVASQYGLEYGGVEAFAEAARLVAPAGIFLAIVHLRDGAIFRECTANLAASSAVLESRVLPHFSRLAEATRGGTAQANLHEADAKLATAVKAVEAILDARGLDVAGGSIFRLHSELGHMHGRLAAYDAREITAWTSTMTNELENYTARMASMLSAAQDEAAITNISRAIEAQGLVVAHKEKICLPSAALPFAWLLRCSRKA